MEKAAYAGDRSAMIYLAKAYESGNGLGTNRFGQHRVCLCDAEVIIGFQAE